METMDNFERLLAQGISYRTRFEILSTIREYLGFLGFPWLSSFWECLWVINVDAHAMHCRMANTIVICLTSVPVHKGPIVVASRKVKQEAFAK